MTKNKQVRIFWKDDNRYHAQCPFCRGLNKFVKNDPIYTCSHFSKTDWIYGRVDFACEDTGIHCPVCTVKFLSPDGVMLGDGQIICKSCGLEIVIKESGKKGEKDGLRKNKEAR